MLHLARKTWLHQSSCCGAVEGGHEKGSCGFPDASTLTFGTLLRYESSIPRHAGYAVAPMRLHV